MIRDICRHFVSTRTSNLTGRGDFQVAHPGELQVYGGLGGPSRTGVVAPSQKTPL